MAQSNERILKIEIEVWSYTLSIVAVYAPTEDSNVNIKDQFMDELTRHLDKISNRKEIIIIIRDLNASLENAKQ